jgi:hypothetical protein
LLNLPSELKEKIGSYLLEDGGILSSLRLTCKDLEAHTFRCFAKARFSSPAIIIHQRSLEVLAELSKHPEIALFVTGLTVYLGQYTEMSLRGNAKGREHFTDLLLEQELSINSGKVLGLLTTCLKNFKNCKTILIRDRPNRSVDCAPLGYRNILSNKSHQHSWDDAWYGSRFRLDMMLRIHTILLSAAKISGAEWEGWRWNTYADTTPSEHPIPYGAFRLSDFKRIMKGLRILVLELPTCAPSARSSEHPCTDLSDILRTGHSLEELRLTFQTMRLRSPFRPEQQLWSALETIILPNLKLLQLRFLHIDYNSFNGFLIRHAKTLLQVELNYVNFEKVEHFQSVLQTMKQELSLKSVSFKYMCQMRDFIPDSLLEGNNFSSKPGEALQMLDHMNNLIENPPPRKQQVGCRVCYTTETY